MDASQSEALDYTQINDFFNTVGYLYHIHNIRLKSTYNTDETGFSVGTIYDLVVLIDKSSIENANPADRSG